MLVHNYPSGDPTPSEADIKVIRDLILAGQLHKIEVLDHIILDTGRTNVRGILLACRNGDTATLEAG